MARMRAGRDPHDPESLFIHAVIALAAGHDNEADTAIVHCAESSISWDRPTRAAHLTALSAICPDLADGLTRLRSIIASVTRTSG